MKNKKIILSLVIISFIVLILMILFVVNEKNKDNEYLKTVVKGVYSDEAAIRNEAVGKLEVLANDGNPLAQWRYGEVLLNANKEAEALLFLEASSGAGVLKATEILGILHLRNPKSDVEILKGFNLLMEAAENGLSLSQSYLGRCFESGGCSLPKDDYLAFYWLTLADENGESGAQFILQDLKEVEISSKRTKEETQKVICEIAPSSQGCNQ